MLRLSSAMARRRFDKPMHGICVAWVIQEKQLGTGHAVLCCQESFQGFAGDVLILSGDVPLIHEETLRRWSNIIAAGKPRLRCSRLH